MAEMSRTLICRMVPQTAVIPSRAEKTPPMMKMPIQPSGETSYRRRMLIRFSAPKAGAGVAASRIGVKASDTRTEGRMNSMKPLGSPKLISTCAVTSPAICTII